MVKILSQFLMHSLPPAWRCKMFKSSKGEYDWTENNGRIEFEAKHIVHTLNNSMYCEHMVPVKHDVGERKRETDEKNKHKTKWNEGKKEHEWEKTNEKPSQKCMLYETDANALQWGCCCFCCYNWRRVKNFFSPFGVHTIFWMKNPHPWN